MASVVLKLITNPRPETPLGGWWEGGRLEGGAGGRGVGWKGGGGRLEGVGGGGRGKEGRAGKPGLVEMSEHLFSFVPSLACH